MSQKLKILIFSAVIALLPSFLAIAQTRSSSEPRFIVGPAKIEAEVNAGESKMIALNIQNQMGAEETFQITFEDFVASEGEGAVELLGNKKSQTSLREMLSVQKQQIAISDNERISVPIKISVPANANPGGHFGAVIVSVLPVGENQTGSTVVTRVASLIFVTVPGNVERHGELISFNTKSDKKFFWNSSIPLRISFKNSGTVNLNPYGGITVKNFLGNTVNKTALDPWFALPDSIRTRDLEIKLNSPFGVYKILAQVNRGYENVIDEKEITVFVFSKIFAVFTLLVIFALAVLVWKSRRKE